MKLNYKRTFCVGFAFFLICLFWQAYDTLIPKILTDKFGMNQTFSGIIMALDNVLALFLLPIFGNISDKHKGKRGKRTPFIIIGTVLSCVLFLVLSFSDQMQLSNISGIKDMDDSAYTVLYDDMQGKELKTPEGESFYLGSGEKSDAKIISKDEFMTYSLTAVGENGKEVTNPDYINYVVPARQAYAWEMTIKNPATLAFFIIILLMLLVSMGTFRSPAVALMPDVTIKPLRSKANAVINLMGAAGGIIVLAMGILFKTGKIEKALMSYVPFITLVVAIMIVSLLIFLLTVREPKFVKEAEELSKKYGIDKEEEETDDTAKKGSLSKSELVSLVFILASVMLWFMGYNAVTSKYSVYASKVLNLDYNLTLMLASGSAIISYIPAGIIASKIGRKKTIMGGVVLLAVAFLLASFLRAGSPLILMHILFITAGIGWATINVNSYPMVVELASHGDIGKFTGYYYTASMLAQTITPIFSGFLMDIRFTLLFPYATVFVALAFVTMIFVKHGDSKPDSNVSIEAFADND